MLLSFSIKQNGLVEQTEHTYLLMDVHILVFKN